MLRLHPVTWLGPNALFGFRCVGASLELHVNSGALTQMQRAAGYSGFRAVRQMREDLAALATGVRSGEFGPVTGVRAISLMGEAGPVLGFHTRPLPHNLGNAFQQYFLGGLSALHNPRGLRERTVQRWPVETWMSADELLARYPERSAKSTTAR